MEEKAGTGGKGTTRGKGAAATNTPPKMEPSDAQRKESFDVAAIRWAGAHAADAGLGATISAAPAPAPPPLPPAPACSAGAEGPSARHEGCLSCAARSRPTAAGKEAGGGSGGGGRGVGGGGLNGCTICGMHITWGASQGLVKQSAAENENPPSEKKSVVALHPGAAQDCGIGSPIACCGVPEGRVGSRSNLYPSVHTDSQCGRVSVSQQSQTVVTGVRSLKDVTERERERVS